jgi:hypothetical protein
MAKNKDRPPSLPPPTFNAGLGTSKNMSKGIAANDEDNEDDDDDDDDEEEEEETNILVVEQAAFRKDYPDKDEGALMIEMAYDNDNKFAVRINTNKTIYSKQ